ncbi:MAG: hypothetical protein MI923_24315 [Phycisphaerales bacterium]|nr:hypothetical protein [Phycisphaerales bacterium]
MHIERRCSPGLIEFPQALAILNGVDMVLSETYGLRSADMPIDCLFDSSSPIWS